MSYISGARSVLDEQVRIASTKIDGIGLEFASGVKGIALNLENENVGIVGFLILILVFVSWMLVRALWYIYSMDAAQIDPFPAHAGGPGGADDEDERRRKRIRRALARHLRTFCKTYCQKMRFCGRFCSKKEKLSVADKLLREEFRYHEAAGRPLRNLENFIKGANRNRSQWDPQMSSHWIYDLMRFRPK